MNWFKRLFLKWSGHTCPVCVKDHWDIGYERWLEDPEWQVLIADQFDDKGNLLPHKDTPRVKAAAKLYKERWEAAREQEELVRKVAAKFNKGSI